jgi:hypothetical protein
MIIILGASILTACAPEGAKNWPFSIGPQTYAVALGDLNGNGHLDAFLANGENEVAVPNTVWLNDGAGNFQNSGQQIGERESRYVILADMDNDGHLDAVVSNTGDISIYFNNGEGVFGAASRNLGQRDGGSYILAPAVGDVNNDGWLDVLGGGCCGAGQIWDDGRRRFYPAQDSLWTSDGQGGYVDSRQQFDILGTKAIALGDLNGNGYLDAFFANHSSLVGNTENLDRFQANTIWFNDGQGVFTMSTQTLGESMSLSVSLGDLDGDGDLDAIVGNEAQDEIWLNQGSRQAGIEGVFLLNSRLGDNSQTRDPYLADFDGNGHLDLLAVGRNQARIWKNDGLAQFTSGAQFTFKPQHALAVGDLNGDGFPDIFAGSVNHGILIWLNDGQGKFTKK